MTNHSIKGNGKYTNHSYKVGLYAASGDQQGFIKDNNLVTLSFPFKDCVLEAGMTKDDTKGGREERYLHSEFNKKDISTLFDPKVLTNFKHFGKNSSQLTAHSSQLTAHSSQLTAHSSQLTAHSSQLNDIEFFDEQGDLKQNLLIKGNNLIALYTLKQRLAGKVKLIYIDPPYNTGSDGFKYNDSFNHASWLTFMKNRLEVAKDLLRDDGVIFVQCDDNEQAYLKVLMDEVFGREAFVTTIHVQMSATQGMKVKAAQNGNIVKNAEYIICFSKDGHKDVAINPLYDSRPKYDEHYNLFLKPNGSLAPLGELYDYRFPKDLNNKKPLGLADAYRKSDEFAEIVRSHLAEIVRSHLAEIVCSDKVGDVLSDKIEQGKWVEVEHGGRAYLMTLDRKGNRRQLLRLSDSWGDIDDYYSTNGLRKIRGNWWSDFYLDMGNVAKEGATDLRNGKKPERLISQIIKMATAPGDIVLDYHLGSGTTAAVAHKMGRRWIGVEQMDYIEDMVQPRLESVINGEQTGISKSIDWQGGGSFVYFELKKYNQEFVDRIIAAETKEELRVVFEDMAKNSFLQFWFNKQDFKEESDYGRLNVEERKVALIKELNENQLYLNYTDMNDTRHKVSADEKLLTTKFYGEDEK